MPRAETTGERLLGRRLRSEKRAGVDHYVPGQHRAERTEERGVYLLGYVDQMGHACQLVVVRPEQLPPPLRAELTPEALERQQEGWLPLLGTRAGQGSVQQTREVREDFRLSDKMLTALTAASLRPEVAS